ncbi:MAG: single-stranded-DNA-specific exonuclease RecJ [Campylobacterota bacterium]|nr:single-stranded-DNA-specific exonuclease RecJ [Campylobacterota bacterium]
MSKTHSYPSIDKTTLKELLNKRFDGVFKKLSDIPEPTLLLNSDRAAERIVDAISKNEKIALVGDYDVDGVTSSAITALFFKEIDYPLSVTIPNRFRDGYGISPTVLERIDADLIITVDNGINAIAAAEICKERGIDLIITDHHTPSEVLPDAYAIVNPKLPGCNYPFKEICGAQVAWLFLALLKRKLHVNVDMSQYLDLLSLAIVADVMPLININRVMVQAGLKMFLHSSRPSSTIIRNFLNKSKLSSEDIGFQIAPRLNSAGRLEDAMIAFNFLTSPTESDAYHYFEQLNELNIRRKSIEADVSEEALLHVNEQNTILVVAGEEWNEGVVGIVAARLCQKYSKPTIALSISDGIAKGSARSVGNVNIYELIKEHDYLLEKFGGHKMAAGLSLSVENLEAFTSAINATASKLDLSLFQENEKIIGELAGDDIDFELLSILEEFEPYGEGNNRPKFITKNAEIRNIKYFGSEKDHSRLTLHLKPDELVFHELLAFRQKVSFSLNNKITCSYTINRNEYRENVSLQLIIERIY